jgi:hypothetical protein
VAIVAIIIVIILVAVGVHSCQVSATNSALQDYTNSVSSLNQQSVANGKQLFTALSQASGASSATDVQHQINQVLTDEQKVYNKAKDTSVPDQVKSGNGDFVMALRMRVDGIGGIANEIQPALSSTATRASINAIAAETAKFYASDVLYKSYALPQIYGALHAAGTRFSPINGDQFVPNVEWVLPSYLASVLHANVPGAPSAKPAPGLHGHSLTSVSVAGTTLQTGATNTIPASPVPSFTLSFSNGGTNNERDVRCKVTVNGTNPAVTGTTTVPETFAGKTATCSVKLNAAPPKGTQTVVATVEPVPGEKNKDNNTITYTVTFQ